MVLFFVIAVSMVAAALAMVVVPIMRPRPISPDPRVRQNIIIARERLSQLEAQAETGLIPPGQVEQEKSEIELALLDDIGGVEDEPLAEWSDRGKWAGFAMVASVPVLAGMLYLTLGQPGVLTPDPEPESAEAPPHSNADMVTIVQRLEQRMAASPDDTQGWYMLGNSYMMLKQFDKAASVFQKLRQLLGDDPDLLVRQADALAMSRGGALAGEPEALLTRALQMDPNHAVALWLAGIAAQRRDDLKAALGYWRRAEPLFGENAESLAELQAMIAQANKDLADTGVVAQPGEGNTASPAATASAPAGKGFVRLNVSLDDSLRDQVSDQDTLFVLARAVSGPPMPLAVVRKQAGDLPLAVTLDDSMAMVPQMKLSNFKEVVIIAKVSKSGEARTQSGDLIGQVSAVSPGNVQRINVVISQQAP